MQPGFEVPILILGYNRPDLMAGLLDHLREIRPLNVYVALDGPRYQKPGDFEKCSATRNIVASQIDWPCHVEFKASPVNLGCKLGVSSGISWFFSRVEEGIIMEDDCRPTPEFYTFCAAMLAKYRNTAQVMMIGGANFQLGKVRGDASYYFSKFTHIWGWATWRRSWALYDLNMSGLDTFLESEDFAQICPHEDERNFWRPIFTAVRDGKIDTWDYQLTYSAWKANRLSIIPNVNLVTNVGFRSDGTHVTDPTSARANVPTATLGTPLRHPGSIIQDVEADRFTFTSGNEATTNSSTKSDSEVSPLKREKKESKKSKSESAEARELRSIKGSFVWRLARGLFSIEKRLRSFK